MKIMEDIALFAKYTGLRREVFNIQVNTTVFGNFFSDEDCKSQVRDLDGRANDLVSELADIVDKHRELFVQKAGSLLDEDGTPTHHMLRMYLLMVYIAGGEVTSTLNYLNDLFHALKPRSTEEERTNSILDFSKQAVMDGYIYPSIDVHTDDGLRVLSADEDIPAGGKIGEVRMTLSASGIELIKDEINDLEEKKRSKSSKDNPVIFDLMTMPSPSKSLN